MRDCKHGQLARSCEICDIERMCERLAEALQSLADGLADHPLFMDGATEEELREEGGDAETITRWCNEARAALAEWEKMKS